MKPMRVCFVSHSAGLRGAERALIEAIDALGHRVQPHVFVPSRGPLTKVLRNREISYSHYLDVPWVTTRRSYPRSAAKSALRIPEALLLAHHVRAQGCAMVYTNSIATSTGAWAARLARRLHVWHIHEFGYKDHGFEFDLGRRHARNVLNRIGGFFILNSYAVAEAMRSLINSNDWDARHRVIYQSVSLPAPQCMDDEADRPSNAGRLLLVGALHENKGQVDAILALMKLRESGLDTDLVLVGEGSYRPYLERLVADLRLQESVRFVGFVDNVTQWYERADIVLVCSRSEAFGRVAVEGMLSGKPIVVAKAGGLQEITEHTVTALHYTPGDVDDLADKLMLLLSDPAYARKIAKQGCSWARDRFANARYGEELYQTLRDLRHRQIGRGI